MKKRKTMDDIALLAGVSKPTVSRVLNGNKNVAVNTRKRVLKVAMENGYVINRQAQRLKEEEVGVVAVVLDYPSFGGSKISDPFIYDLLASITKILNGQNRDVLIVTPPDNESANYYISLVSAAVVDGVIFLGRGLKESLYSDLLSTSVPFVVWGEKLGDEGYCSVGSDGFWGGRKAGKYLIESHKRRDIVFVGDVRHKEIHARRAGLQAIIDELGYDVNVRDVVTNDFSYEQAYVSAKRLVHVRDRIPDGLFVYSDVIAMAFVAAFREAGILAPKNYNVVGYNNIGISRYFYPALTTLSQDVNLAANHLVKSLDKLLVGEIAAPRSLEPLLIDRGS